jgi:predicted transcriptional regulator
LLQNVFCSLFANSEQKNYLCVMKAHKGMRPHDVVILLKLILAENQPLQYRDLSFYLFISVSEIAESLNRSHIAGLVDESKRKVYRQSLMEFIIYGLHYVFPQQPGHMVTGIATAHSHPFYSSQFSSELNYVWPDENGNVRGLSIQPLYDNAVKAVRLDNELYKLLASIDIIRVGRVRELKVAISELKKVILHEPS